MLVMAASAATYSSLCPCVCLQHYAFVTPLLTNRFADPSCPLGAWLLLREAEFRRLMEAGHDPRDISVFGVTDRSGEINHLRFPTEASLRTQLTTLVMVEFEDPNLQLTFHSFRHIFYMRA